MYYGILFIKLILWGCCPLREIQTLLVWSQAFELVWPEGRDTVGGGITLWASPCLLCPFSLPLTEKYVRGLPRCEGHNALEKPFKCMSGLAVGFFFTMAWRSTEKPHCVYDHHPFCFFTKIILIAVQNILLFFKMMSSFIYFLITNKFILNDLLFTDAI